MNYVHSFILIVAMTSITACAGLQPPEYQTLNMRITIEEKASHRDYVELGQCGSSHWGAHANAITYEKAVLFDLFNQTRRANVFTVAITGKNGSPLSKDVAIRSDDSKPVELIVDTGSEVVSFDMGEAEQNCQLATAMVPRCSCSQDAIGQAVKLKTHKLPPEFFDKDVAGYNLSVKVKDW
ncbi:MAG: hypothetical protein WCK65_09685 [Rhodospirillaceae bacterium]